MPSLYFPKPPEVMWFKAESHYTSHLKFGCATVFVNIAFDNIRPITPNGGSCHKHMYLFYFSKAYQVLNNPLTIPQASAINRILREMVSRIYTHIF